MPAATLPPLTRSSRREGPASGTASVPGTTGFLSSGLFVAWSVSFHYHGRCPIRQHERSPSNFSELLEYTTAFTYVVIGQLYVKAFSQILHMRRTAMAYTSPFLILEL